MRAPPTPVPATCLLGSCEARSRPHPNGVASVVYPPRTGRGSEAMGPVHWALLAPASVVRLTALLGLVFAAACGGGDGPTEPPGPPAQLVKSEGDQQAWYFGNPLPTPYRVAVLDANGRGVPGVTVGWEVTSGGGSVDPLESETDSDGIASTTHTLGTETSYAVTASAIGLPDVEFSASASNPPTSGAVTVGNNFFSPRDVVVQVNGTVTWT